MKLGQILPRLRTDLPVPHAAGVSFMRTKVRFRSLRKIGQGAFGAAYSARYRNRPVIVKVALGTPGLITPFESINAMKREVRILGKLQKYPFVPRLLEVGVDYFVLEDVQGLSLLDLLDKKGLEARELLSSVVATGIIASVLHREGIAHNDLEPRNILLTPNGVVVIDFGISVEKAEDQKNFVAAMERDIISLIENIILVLSSREVPQSIRIILTSTIEKYRKKVIARDVDEDTARELSRELIFALAQLGARAVRGRKLPADVIRVTAV